MTLAAEISVLARVHWRTFRAKARQTAQHSRLLALTILVYFQVHDFEFVNFDDRETIVGNTHIQNGLTWAGMVWAFTASYAANWFPVTWISHMLDVQLFGLDSGWHHLINVMIHAASKNGSPIFCLKKNGTQIPAPAITPLATVRFASARCKSHSATRIQNAQSPSYSGIGMML